jgi:protein pelota
VRKYWCCASQNNKKAKMKIQHRRIDGKTGEGVVKLLPEEPEDLWHIFNLLTPNSDDKVTAVSFRKITTETSTGSTSSDKKKVKVTVNVEEVDYDAAGESIRVKGKNQEESEFIKLGQYHTVELGLSRPVTIWKSNWDSMHLERIQSAANPAARAEVAAILMQDGLCHLLLITANMMVSVGKIEQNMPRKRQPDAHAKALKKFFGNVLDTMLRNLKFDVLRCVIIASPGFLKDEFVEHMNAEMVRNDIKVLAENKHKFLAVSCSSGHRHSLKEILSDPVVQSKIEDTKAVKDVQALDKFFDMLSKEPDRAFYGFKHVQAAIENQAVDSLLITDELFRTSTPEMRQKYVGMLDQVKSDGGSVHVFSSIHPSGERKFNILFLLSF